jgi:lactate dehydrogenase-like 2-hydroxyacid dehydrogenase
VSRPRLVVARVIPEPALDLLGEAGELWVSDRDAPLEREDLEAAVSGATAIVTLLHDRVDGDLLDAAGPQLRCVANVAVGYDNIDVDAATSRGCWSEHARGLTEATADLAPRADPDGPAGSARRARDPSRAVLAHVLHARHRTAVKDARDRRARAIGAAVARRARAFGMRIAYWAPGRDPSSGGLTPYACRSWSCEHG